MRFWLLVLAACSRQITPATPSIGVLPDAPSVGHRISIASSWSAICENTELDRIFDRPPEKVQYAECGHRGYRIEVTCTPACLLATGSSDSTPSNAKSVGSSSADDLAVIPTAVGPFQFRVQMKDGRGAIVQQYVSPELVVRAPEAVSLYCYYPDEDQFGYVQEPDYLVPCDGRALSHKRPFVWPVASYRQWTYPIPMAALGGHTKLSSRTLRLMPEYENVRTLADVFPDRRAGKSAGDGVKPGSYDVDVELYGVKNTVHLEVR